MVSACPSTLSESSSGRRFSNFRIQTTFSESSFQHKGGMDIADVKLHKLMPIVTVEEMPSSPASVSSSGSFSSISSRTSNYKAIYPPEVSYEEDSMDSVMFGNSPRERRMGSIDQLIEWTRNASDDNLTDYHVSAQAIPPSGSECPLLTNIPMKVMNLCGCNWGRIQSRMNLQLLCRGVQDCSQLGVYEIASGTGRGAYVAAIILYARHIAKASILEQRMREIADQEWKDIPPIRVWWVNEERGAPISAPMASREQIAWNPIRFRSRSSRSTSGSSYQFETPRKDVHTETLIETPSPALRPHFPRRHSSAIAQTPEELSPNISKHGDLLTDELDAKLRKLILSGQ